MNLEGITHADTKNLQTLQPEDQTCDHEELFTRQIFPCGLKKQRKAVSFIVCGYVPLDVAIQYILLFTL